jgi:hypothetical protein
MIKNYFLLFVAYWHNQFLLKLRQLGIKQRGDATAAYKRNRVDINKPDGDLKPEIS